MRGGLDLQKSSSYTAATSGFFVVHIDTLQQRALSLFDCKKVRNESPRVQFNRNGYDSGKKN